MEKDLGINVVNKKDNDNKIGNKKLVNISKELSYLLRHGAIKEKLNIDTKGFVLLDEVLDNKTVKRMKTSRDMIYEVVRDNNKKRFEIQTINGKEYIRAVQGHTLTEVKNEEALDEIPNIYEYPTIIHGTYFEAWEFIKKTGLNKMSRNCIHFAIGDNSDKNVISGMRGNVQLIVEIDAPLCVANGIKMYISTNKVVLSEGVNGAIEPKYFKRVYSKTGECILSMLYQLAIVPFYTVEQDNFKKELILKSIVLIDLNSGNIEFEIVNENKSSEVLVCWNSFFNTFLDKKFNTKSTIIVLFNRISILYSNMVKKLKQSDVRCMSLMSEYVELKSDIDEVNNYSNTSLVLKEVMNIDSKFLIKISLDNKEGGNESEKGAKDKDQKILPYKKQILKDCKEELLNNKSDVNIILLFINYEEDGDIKNVEYFIIKKFDFSQHKYYTSDTFSSYSSTQKNFIAKFMDEMKENLVKNGIFEKLLILAGFRNDISTLTSMMKKSGYKIPQIFQNNVIELYEKDFNGLMPGDNKLIVETLYLLYLADDITIKNKIKIINNM